MSAIGHPPIIIGKMHFLLIHVSENEFLCEIKFDGITSLHGIHGNLVRVRDSIVTFNCNIPYGQDL